MAVDSPKHVPAAATLLARRAHELRDGLALLVRQLAEPTSASVGSFLACKEHQEGKLPTRCGKMQVGMGMGLKPFGAASQIVLELLARVEVTSALGSLPLGARLRLSRLGCVSLVHVAALTVEDFQLLGFDRGDQELLHEGVERSRSLLNMIDAKVLETMPLMSIVRDVLKKVKWASTESLDSRPKPSQYNEILRLAEQFRVAGTSGKYESVDASSDDDVIETFQRTLNDHREIFSRQRGMRNVVETLLENDKIDGACLHKVPPSPPSTDEQVPDKEGSAAQRSADESMGHPKEPVLSQISCIQSFKSSDFELVGVLGRGSFGSVTLDVHLSSGKAYALKRVSKTSIVHNGLEDKVLNEYDILRELVDCTFIATLHGTINDSSEFVCVMEPCLGGELLVTYDREGLTGSWRHTRFYVAGVACALEYLHQKRIVYRDLKPENLLLCRSGYAKLADMGIAKYVEGATYTICGSFAYFAPEVISQQGYGVAVDWWALGVFTYELFTGHTPFQSSEPIETYKKIIKGIAEVSFMNFAIEVEDFIRGLCARDPSNRLPLGANGISSLTSHMWFHDFDWPSFRAQTMVPDFVPILRTDRDLSNFPQARLPMGEASEGCVARLPRDC